MYLLEIRKIKAADNIEVGAMIRKILLDMGVPKIGTAYADTDLDDMYKAYKKEKSSYFVALESNRILGCAGIAPLQNEPKNVCELQKMYVKEEARGSGIAQKLMDVCIEEAKGYGYDGCYLETMPYMKAAQKLYTRNGFGYLEERMGDTGHYSCPVFMLKKL